MGRRSKGSREKRREEKFVAKTAPVRDKRWPEYLDWLSDQSGHRDFVETKGAEDRYIGETQRKFTYWLRDWAKILKRRSDDTSK